MICTKEYITQQDVLDFFKYEPHTGILKWGNLKGKRSRWSGMQAGCIDSYGYRVVVFYGRLYKAHRLIWLYVHGKWPTPCVDHINGNKLDNRLCNLREISWLDNSQNKHRYLSNNTTMTLGVSLDKNRYRASITTNGKKIILGRFSTISDASDAYQEAKMRLHTAYVRSTEAA